MTDLEVADIEAEAALDALSRHDAREARIEQGLATFMQTATDLMAIRDEKSYRLKGHKTFEQYCRTRWGFSDSRARQLIGAAETVTTVTDLGLPAPTNEAQARELAKVPAEQRAEVWAKVVDVTDGKPTAAAVRAAAAPPPPVSNPFDPPAAASEPTTLPESPQSQEVPPVLSGAVLDRDQFLERRAAKEAADHARHVSDRLRHIVEYCVEGLGSPAIRAQYVDIYEPPAPDIRERVAVNADNIEAAADALRVFAQLWRERRESAEEQH